LGFLVLVLAGAILAGFVFLGWGGGGASSAVTPGLEQRVEIPPGVSAEGMAQILKRQGIIEDELAFLLRVETKGVAGDLKPGSYLFRTGQDVDTVLDALQQGAGPSGRRVTIPEGLSVSQTAARVTDAGLDGAAYSRQAGTPSRFSLPQMDGLPTDLRTLEGLLFPQTYFLPEGQGPEDLIQMQLDTFAQETAGLPWARSTELGVTEYQVVVVASLVEKEARVPEERALVAAVIYNRLGKDMSLGIDATVRFALDKWSGPLTQADLDDDSPYNTRKHKGLPPGPIASPGLAALEAALQPADVDYLYYVLQDEAGHHFFTASYDEFLEASKNQPPPD